MPDDAWLGSTNLYYYRARYYSPKLGRFLQTDPVGIEDDLNLYVYAVNEPVMTVDPSGRVIEIVGSEKFKEQINEQITAIAETPTGGPLVAAVGQSSYVFRIVESTSESSTQASDRKASEDGTGSGGTVEHNPTWTPKANTSQGEMETPSEIVLGHELVHAKDIVEGTVDVSIDRNTGNRRSEDKAVEIENKIRREMNLPERLGYD